MTDQAAADRERIAGEMKSRGAPACLEMAPTLDAAVRAFEVLCEPAEWVWWCGVWPYDGKIRRIWWARKIGIGREIRIDGTCNHAADVCRLVCEVLDKEAK